MYLTSSTFTLKCLKHPTLRPTRNMYRYDLLIVWRPLLFHLQPHCNSRTIESLAATSLSSQISLGLAIEIIPRSYDICSLAFALMFHQHNKIYNTQLQDLAMGHSPGTLLLQNMWQLWMFIPQNVAWSNMILRGFNPSPVPHHHNQWRRKDAKRLESWH